MGPHCAISVLPAFTPEHNQNLSWHRLKSVAKCPVFTGAPLYACKFVTSHEMPLKKSIIITNQKYRVKTGTVQSRFSDSLVIHWTGSNWLELAWQYIAMTRNNLCIISISLAVAFILWKSNILKNTFWNNLLTFTPLPFFW